MRFRLFPSDLEGSGSYRLLYPYGALEAFAGHESYITVDESARTVKGYLPLQMPAPFGDIPAETDADVYVFQRCLQSTFRVEPNQWTRFGVTDIIRWLQSHSKTVVVEVDDWMHNGLPQGAPAFETMKRRFDLSFDTLAEAAQIADILTVSTPALAEAYGRGVVLTNYLHWPTWDAIQPSYDRDRRLRVGWFGALNWRGSDLSVLRGLIGPWLERHPDIDFVAAGSEGDATHDYLGIPHGQRITYPYTVFPGHADFIQEIDIGLVPLTPGRFNECKSHLKGLEYAACGIPCIATPTGPYREWVEPGINGLLASKPRQWVNALDEMLTDDRWRVMGCAARVKAAEHHTIQDDRNWRQWEAIFASSDHRDVRPVPSRARQAA